MKSLSIEQAQALKSDTREESGNDPLVPGQAPRKGDRAHVDNGCAIRPAARLEGWYRGRYLANGIRNDAGVVGYK